MMFRGKTRHQSNRYHVEYLEERRLLSTFTVSSIADSGVGSLRQAINDANGSPNSGGPDVIAFSTGSGRIDLQSLLPDITEPVVIDGRSAPGFGSTPIIQIDGGGTTAGLAYGLHITGGNSTVQGLVLTGFAGSAILTDTAGGNTIIGNYIGVGPDGTTQQANAIGVQFSSSDNVIGGLAALDRNIISGNNIVNVEISGDRNTVTGNYVGVGAAGVPVTIGTITSEGILIADGTQNVIGATDGAALAGMNVISGNSLGIVITGEGGNTVSRNLIGTDPAGTSAVPNITWGIFVNAPSNVIGGSDISARNIISGNSDFGLGIDGSAGNQVLNNVIGLAADLATPLGNQAGIVLTDATGTLISGNTITANGLFGIGFVDSRSTSGGNTFSNNSIYGNTGLGIDLGLTGPTPNDAGDVDTGPNGLLNFPVITSATSSGGVSLDVTGTYDGAANAGFTIEIYSSPSQNSSGFGEGKALLATVNVTTDSSGHASFSRSFSGIGISPSEVITATATDGDGNTSEFSQAFSVDSVGQISATGRTLGSVAASLDNVVLATFVDAVSGTSASDYVATIYWGDDTATDTGTVQVSGNGFEVVGSHQYAQQGLFSALVTITDVNDNRTAFASSTIGVSTTNLPLVVVARNLSARVDVPLVNVRVGQISDNNPDLATDDYTVIIDWGDDSETSFGDVTRNASGNLIVTGSHTYEREGSFDLQVSVETTDSRSAVDTGLVSVFSTSIQTRGINVAAVEGLVARNVRVATFTDLEPRKGGRVTYSAQIDWGDGRHSKGTITQNAAGQFVVRGSHAYRLAGSYPVDVTITGNGQSTTSDSNAQVINAPRLGRQVRLTARSLRRGGRIFSFLDVNRLATAKDYSATINWGDETQSQGKVHGGLGSFDVLADSHIFAKPGRYIITITVMDSLDDTFQVQQAVRIR